MIRRAKVQEDAIMRALRDHPEGITRMALAELFGASGEHVRGTLRRLREDGKVLPTAEGSFRVRWSLPENIEIARAAVRREVVECLRAGWRRRNKVRREQRAAALDRPPMQIVVPAAQCRPVHTRAPCSVFHLAEAA